jgi:ribonuclease VapC
MFIDASAIVAILAQEEDWRELSARLSQAEHVSVSPLSIWEATLGLMRQSRVPFEKAEELVRRFVDEVGASIVAIDDAVGIEALSASRLFGRGRHKADLNLGDCFAYACARGLQVPLLYEGNDFGHTDIERA